MKLNFLNPWTLLLLPFLLAFVIYFGRKRRESAFQKRILILIRSVICILLVLSLSGMTIKQFSDVTTTVFAVDLSASVKEEKEAMTQFLLEAARSKEKNDKIGIICFGENAVIEARPSEEGSFSAFRSYVNESGTNIADALKLAFETIPKDSAKRLVLVSDGNETSGNAEAQARALKTLGVTVDAYAVTQNVESEVQLTELKTPKYSSRNMEFPIEVSIYSLQDTTTRLKLFRGQTVIANENIPVKQGENRFIFTDTSDIGGGLLYRAEIETADDTVLENNKAYAFCYIEDVPAVLILQKDGSGSEMEKMLESAKIRVTTLDIREAPVAMDRLSAYQAIILANLSIEWMPDGFPEALQTYVQHTGGGLVVTGGENAFALGGYLGSPLETILPIDMQLKTESQMADLGLVMVIDRSGSMSSTSYGLSTMEIAKEAAIRGMETLNPEDYVGVVAFDTTPLWSVPLQNVGENTEVIKTEIGKIQPGGGTSILPALKEAFQKLQAVDAKMKHIILLTDGQAEQNGYDQLLNQMNVNGVTLSTVAVGRDADALLLEKLAEKGNGRYYYTNEFTNLPEIFAKEAFLAGKEYINNRSFYPIVQDSTALLTGIEQLGEMHGYVSTTPKARADISLISDKEEPVLASWQFGLGRTVAFTSDLQGIWSSDFLGNEEGVRLFRNMVSYVLRSENMEDIQIEAKASGGKSEVFLHMAYDETISSITATALASDGTQFPLTFITQSPGTYTGEMNSADEGAYIITIEIMRKNGETSHINSGFHLPYPEEYNIKNNFHGMETLKKITSLTGGTIYANPAEVFTKEIERAYTDKSLIALLMVTALLLFVIEIGLRRFSFILNAAENKAFLWKAAILQKNAAKRDKGFVMQSERKSSHPVQESAVERKKIETLPTKENTASKLAGKRRNRNQ